MDTAPPPARSSERLISFLDAAVAIALTLLILPLMESVSEAVDEQQTLGDYAGEHSWQLLAFSLSFLIIAMFWRMHHGIQSPDTPLTQQHLTLQLAWLFTITLMPVVTALTGGLDTDRALVASYVGNLAVSAWLLFVIAVVERRDRRAAGLAVDATLPATPLAVALLFTLTLLLALIVPSYTWLFLMALSGLVRGLLVRFGVVGRDHSAGREHPSGIEKRAVPPAP
ncbi:TMEM175 family protein [Promicromonospora sukumoe]|uniref:Putative membrane protein n=1 Tax=Promicromonospora sukumoe TaxID=88382 RepID=A0A7W3PF41_9MICO|nr:TMEM175 family protein [Promicromonospora sukumoe]MBA8809204.1 putative membrane protein [Promicromonospora sukumoe]